MQSTGTIVEVLPGRMCEPSVGKGFKSMMQKGRKIGAPVVNVRVVVNDGASHTVDSSDVAFQPTISGGHALRFPSSTSTRSAAGTREAGI